MKRLPITPRSQIVAALRRLFLRSRERAACLKRDKATCSCGKKRSVAKGKEVKVQVHHKEGITNWDEVVASIRKNILCDVSLLETKCKKCHKEETDTQRRV